MRWSASGAPRSAGLAGAGAAGRVLSGSGCLGAAPAGLARREHQPATVSVLATGPALADTDAAAGPAHRKPARAAGRRCTGGAGAPGAAGACGSCFFGTCAGIIWMTGRMYSRAVCPRLRASLPSWPGTVMTRLSPSMTTSEPDTPRPVDARADDLLRLVQGLTRRPEPSGVRAVRITRVPPCRSMPSLGLPSLSPVRKTSRYAPTSRYQEKGQVAVWVHRRRRRCHVSLVSLSISYVSPAKGTWLCRMVSRLSWLSSSCA